MESPNKERKKASLTDVEEGTCLTFPHYGSGSFLIGLSSEDKVCLVNWEEKDNNRFIVVELFRIDQTSEGGFYLTPLTSDLPCLVNRNRTKERRQLLKECKIEIGDKVLRFSDGTRKPRKLPPTPGVMVLPSAPPKPRRNNDQGMSDEDIEKEDYDDLDETDDGWQGASSLGADGESKGRATVGPDQIASVAASHVVRQMMLYTDLKMSVTMMDELYRAFQNVVEINRDMLQDFLEESKKELEQNKRAKSSGQYISQPLHGPVIELLVELLKHSLDPVSHVILWLLFLRTLSHFTQNLEKLVECQAGAAIMGSMAVYLEVPEVQQYGLEILCKLATYQPQNPSEKAPVRETAVEMILRAMKFHEGALSTLRPACRALANLVSTVSGLLSQTSSGNCEANREATRGRQALLAYIRTEAVPVIRDVMSVFPRDLGIQMESRRVLAVYSQEHHVTDRSSSSSPDLDRMEEEAAKLDDDDTEDEDQENPPPGILKSARSYESLRSPKRKVQFTSETVGGSLSSDSIFLDSLDASGGFDSGSGRFMDSFGNEMDMPDSATYIGEENIFFPETSNLAPPLVYVPSNSGREDSEQTEEVSSPSESKTRFTALDAEIENNANQMSEDSLIEKSLPQSADRDCGGSSLKSTNQDTELSTVAMEMAPPVPVRQPIIKAKEEQMRTDPTAADVKFLTRLMRSVITGHVCSLVLSGEDSQALQAIDQPLESLLQSAQANQFLCSSMAKEYSLNKSLMDIDPVMVISIIDAVRYRSLTCDLLKSSLTELLSRISDKLNIDVSMCAFDSIYLTIADVNLEPVFLEKKFIRQMIKSLPDVQGEFLKTKVEELQIMLTDLL